MTERPPGMRLLVSLLASACLLAAVFLSASPARAQDPQTTPEVWRFRKGDVEREIDVSALPEDVRAALLERLEADGFERVDAGGTSSPRPASPREAGVDVRADVRALVEGHGRFPGREDPPGRPSSGLRTSLERAARALADAVAAARGAAGGTPSRLAPLLSGLSREARGEGPRAEVLREILPALGRALGLEEAGPATATAVRASFLGARVALLPPPQRGARLVLVPGGSLAAALGLEAGDVIDLLDGRPPTAPRLRAWADGEDLGGQRTLRLRRREGGMETWSVEVVPRGRIRSDDGEPPAEAPSAGASR